MITFHETSNCLESIPEIKNIFVEGISREPLHAFLGLGKDYLKKRYSEKYLEEKFQEGLSLVAKDGDKVVGATLGYVQPLAKYEAENFDPKEEPLHVIRSKYFQEMGKLFPHERCVFFNHIVLEGYGLGFELIKTWLDLTHKKGFKVVFAISVTKKTWEMIKVCFYEQNFISYKDFEFNGKKILQPLSEKQEGARLAISKL